MSGRKPHRNTFLYKVGPDMLSVRDNGTTTLGNDEKAVIRIVEQLLIASKNKASHYSYRDGTSCLHVDYTVAFAMWVR
jgi:hypothetical protein